MAKERRRTKFNGNGSGQDNHRAPLPEYITYSHIKPQDALFLYELLADMNPAQAALRAGMAEDNKPATAARVAEERLEDPAVNEAFQAAVRDRTARTMVTADRVIHEYAKLAFTSPDMLYDDNWNLKKLSDLPPEVRASIQEVDRTVDVIETEQKDGSTKRTTRYRTKVKQHSKTDALKVLAQHVGAIQPGNTNFNFNDNRQYTQNNKYNVQIGQMLAKLEKDELRLLTKMAGDEDGNLTALEDIQDQCLTRPQSE